MRGQKIGGSGTLLSGPSARAARCRGNLHAATTLLRSFRSLGNTGVVIMCTDLNVSRAIDIVVAGRDDTAALCSALSGPFQAMKAVIQKEVERGSFVMASYRPHRIEPDGFDKSQWRGDERLYAVTSGKFKIYPCLDKKNWDCMEVRYVGTAAVRQEIYLDYGADEAELYVQNAAALNETERLLPETLARVDPQAFWAAVLHVDTFFRALESHGDASLVGKWLVVFDGVKKSREKWRKVAEDSRIRLPAAIVTGENSAWSIKSDADHEKIASGCSSIALLMMLKELECETPLHFKFDVLDCYRMSELASFISAITAAKRKEADHLARGKVLHMKDRAAFMKLSLEEAGYGNGIYVSTDPLETCHHCKKLVDDMKMCSKCNGVAYCGADCARASWKVHKKECRPTFAHIRRCVMYLANEFLITIDPYMSQGNSAPTETCLISEASGTGSLGIMWNPCQLSFITLNKPNAVSGGSPHALEGESMQGINMENVIPFRSISELDPPRRFLVACGPLPDISVARGCVDEAISMAGGDIAKLKMDVVNFTALEWAAKKGNADIVEWLCSDCRTKSLIGEGCPVGWACYTGKVEIARKLVAHGADPTRTDNVLFFNCPPLLVAAENGQLEAMKYLVDELGHDVFMVGPTGRNLIESIKCPPNWRDLEGHREAYAWAKSKMR
mmetsp:Transcript_37409/g.81886  ORF Transcript_37409/g.81886 Transcript_37409/m.81886 type:complete len:674 (+) Transcript_37409:382-2403(+)